MKKKVIGFIFCLVLLFGISFISSMQVTIKTLQYYWVEVTVADGTIADYSKLEQHDGDSDQYGDFVFNLNTTVPEINLYITVKKDGKMGEAVFSNKKFIGETTDEPIYLELIPEGGKIIETPDVVSNESVESNETLNESISEEESNADAQDSQITGSAVGNFFKSKTFYIVLIVLVVLIVAVVLFKIIKSRRNNSSPDREIKVRKLSEMKQERDEKIDDHRQVIEEAERKIKEAQEEISRLKNQDKIKDMERRISDEERELIRLRNGG